MGVTISLSGTSDIMSWRTGRSGNTTMAHCKLYLLKAVALLGTMALLAPAVATLQAQGPIGDQPRRPRPDAPRRPGTIPGPGAPPDAPADIPRVQTRAPQRTPEEQPLFTADTNVVTVDIAVLDNKGQFIPNIPSGNFQILEDGVPQKIISVGPTQSPATVALLIEFSNRWQSYWSETWYQTLTATYGFVQTLRPEDWVAVIAYDLRPEILADFTQDRREINNALQRLRIAAYSESNLFDALADTVQRMEEIEGRKAVVLLSSGEDTFSRLNFSQARRIVQEAGVTVHAIGLGQMLKEMLDSYGYVGGATRIGWLQADNQLRTFTRETGGFSFFPRFYGEFPTIFQSLNYLMRNQYTAVYQPSNTKRDGTFRKITVRLVDPNTNKELRITGKKNKRIKYDIVARKGYTAPREVE
ncbi:MAG: VWA domain-containing protein [Acidobacteriia bacterium]|nr:VWA domain-containing protein [Terriglobia bacterium]MYG02595.1 VWA domain-containing protein [Terriglobia bacterium]MYK10145.1 VWA domain-containing protein [Terriglobia bacterium]